jgi:putative ABC transport system permease protein
MAMLNNDHIDYIIRDLRYRGVILENCEHEMVDHICSAVEVEMERDSNSRFIDAYHQVLRSFGHTSGLRKTQFEILRSENSTPKLMFRNYLNIAWRNLAKHRFYTLINVTGLAVGIAACLVIALYIRYELSYDRHFQNSDRIYRINAEILFNGNHHRLAVMPPAAADAFQRDFPEVEAATHFRDWGWRWIRRSTDSFKEQYVAFASNEVFKVFSIPLISGNAATALVEPNSLVISKSKADKYFPGEEALGQTLIIDNDQSYKITGVFNDFPTTTHFRLDFMVSMEGLEESKSTNWLSNNFNTYILLREGSAPQDLEAKFPKLIDKYIGPQVKAVFGQDFSMDKFFASGNKLVYTLMPITDIHLHSDLTAEMGVNSDITYIYLFGAIALFILAIACINFMNLSTARSASRAKEVGVRKVLGSLRSHLVRQFLTESFVLSFFSFILAIGLVYVVLPGFNLLAERSLTLPLTDPAFLFSVVLAALVVGILSGLYPSVFLSAFKPVHVLKGKIAPGMKSRMVRSSLVVFQFMISIFLIIGTITVQKQLNFIQNKKLGFTKDQVIVIHNTETLGTQHEAFKNQLLQNPAITNVSISGYIPIAGWGRSNTSFWPHGQQPAQDNMVSMEFWSIDHDYIPTMGMKIKLGRNFSREFGSDSTGIIINESAVKHFGFKDPIGEKIETYTFDEDAIEKNKTRKFTVVGVVSDFHFESLRQSIAPLCLYLGDSKWSMPVKFKSQNAGEVIEQIKKEWMKVADGKPFEYSFLDEAFGRMYASEKRLGSIFGIFAALAIVIACLGLFALTAFTAEQRTKEIGIRKVLGASVSSIVLLLSKEFGKLILMAFLLSLPIVWFSVNWWLESYTYKVEIGAAVYLLTGILALLIAWLTMSFQSIKAAISNPINSLRSE